MAEPPDEGSAGAAPDGDRRARSIRAAGRPFLVVWGWARIHASPTQTLVAIAALLIGVAALVVAIIAIPSDPAPPPLRTEIDLVSATKDNKPGDKDSGRPSISADGRYVAFTSAASNFVPRSPVHYNIYRKDRVTGEVVLISRTAAGEPGNADSQFPSICRRGRFIAFASAATNLVVGLPPLGAGKFRVYVHDTLTRLTTLVSATGTGEPADDDSRSPSLSEDCSSVAFESEASNLAPGTDSGNQVYLRDLVGRRTTRVSVAPDGRPLGEGSFGPDLSRSGRLIAFTTLLREPRAPEADFFVVHVHDMKSGRTTPISDPFRRLVPGNSGFAWPNFSPDERYTAFRSLKDTDPAKIGPHVFVWDNVDGRSAVRGPDGAPTGWDTACTDGVTNGTRFAPGLSGNGSRENPYRIIFTVRDGSTCRMVFRDFDGNDVPIDLGAPIAELIEPAINVAGDVISWVVTAGSPWQVYACSLTQADVDGDIINVCR